MLQLARKANVPRTRTRIRRGTGAAGSMSCRTVTKLVFIGSLASLSICAGCTLFSSLDGVVGPPVDDTRDADADALGRADTDARVDGASHAEGGGTDAFDGAIPDDSSAPSGAQAVYAGLISPLGVALTATDVCWVAGDLPRGLFCAPKTGGGASTIRSLDAADDAFLTGAFDLALDDTYVYWGNGPGNQNARRPLASAESQQY